MNPEQLLEMARRRSEAAEVFVLDSQETPVSFEANRLKAAQARQTSGVALRLIKDGRIGFAASTKPDEDAAALVAIALETAPFGPEARFTFPDTVTYPDVDVYDPGVEAVSLEHMAQLGQQVIDRLRRHTPDLLCDGSVRKATLSARILNSSGADLAYRHSVFSLFMEGTLVRGTDMLFVGDGEASCQPVTDITRIVETMERQLEWARENVPAPTGQVPVVFTPRGVAGALIAPLVMALSGRTVYQKMSPLTDSLGKAVYDGGITLTDDPTIPFRPGSRPFDDEGVPSRPVVLIERGTVRSFLYDLQTAGLAGTESTGSGSRSLTSQPSISTSNLILAGGETSFDAMVQNISDGLVVEQLMGAGQGNVLGGEVSGNVLLGYRIRDGRVLGRVKDTMVALNVHQALKDVAAIGNDSRWLGGSLFTPSLCLARVSVSTKEQ